MSYRIKIHGRIGDELQRVADEEVGAVLAHLASLERGVADAGAIHEARKHLKKLRALVQLLREPLGVKSVRAEEAVFRDAGRKLQRMRDAQALAATLEALTLRFFDRQRPAVVVAARQVLTAEENRARRSLTRPRGNAALLASLRAAQARAAAWPLAEFRWKHLTAALRRSYRRAREAWRLAATAPKSRALHAWRRRTKELWCHVTLLHHAAPGFMEELAGELEVLGEFLGDDHDLIVLRKTLAGHPSQVPPGHTRDALFETFALRREELLDAAFDLAQRVFDDPPGEFLTRSKSAATRCGGATKKRIASPSVWPPSVEALARDFSRRAPRRNLTRHSGTPCPMAPRLIPDRSPHMPISYVIDQRQQFVRTTVTGSVTVQEIVDHLIAQRRDKTVPYRELVDVCGVTAPYMTSSQVWQAAQAVLAVTLESAAGPRAVLVGNDAVYGISRMFATLVEDTFPIRVFRDRVAAEHWLLHEYAK